MGGDEWAARRYLQPQQHLALLGTMVSAYFCTSDPSAIMITASSQRTTPIKTVEPPPDPGGEGGGGGKNASPPQLIAPPAARRLGQDRRSAANPARAPARWARAVVKRVFDLTVGNPDQLD